MRRQDLERSFPLHLRRRLGGCAILGALLWRALGQAESAHADALGAELILLTVHVQSQRDAPAEHYDRKLDGRGQAVVTPGVELYYDRQLAEPLLRAGELRFTAALFEDSVRHRFYYVHVGAVWTVLDADPWRAVLVFGPGFIARESWRGVPGYQPDNPLEESDRFLPGYEYKFLPLGSVDLQYRLAPAWQAVYSLFPGIPYVLTHSVGLRRSF